MKLTDFQVGQVFLKDDVALEVLTVESSGVLKIKTTEGEEESVGLWDWRRFDWIVKEYGFKLQ